MDAKKRIEVRAELVAQGYSFDYVDSWPPKVTLYPHRDLLNTEGQVAIPRGTPLPNHPGHPDHMARKSRIGLLSWPPSESCRCKACRELAVAAQPETVAPAPMVPPLRAAVAHEQAKEGACSCGFQVHGKTLGGRKRGLQMHIQRKLAAA